MMYKDLKLSHVFVDKNDLQINLIDFGMSEELDEYNTTSRPGGTFHCMSPEMAYLYQAKLLK